MFDEPSGDCSVPMQILSNDIEAALEEQEESDRLPLIRRTLRSIVMWLSAQASVPTEQLSFTQARSLAINAAGLLVGTLSTIAAFVIALMYIGMGQYDDAIIPGFYVVVMISCLLLLRHFAAKCSSGEMEVKYSSLFFVYLISLSLLVGFLPMVMHIFLGGVQNGCSSGVLIWSVLGPAAVINLGTRVNFDRREGAREEETYFLGDDVKKTSARAFLISVLLRCSFFVVVVYFDVMPRKECVTSRVFLTIMYIGNQIACPFLVLLIYKQMVEWVEERCKVVTCLESKIRRRNMRSKKLITSLVPKFAARVFFEMNPSDWHTNSLTGCEDCSILQMDIVKYSSISSTLPVTELIDLLNALFSSIDFAAETIGKIWKVETIGDCYIAVAGGPQPCRDHADRAVLLGCSIVKIAKSISKAVGIQLEVRIGIHSGDVMAAVLGSYLPRFLVFGSNFQIASKLEEKGVASHVHLSSSTADLLRQEWNTEPAPAMTMADGTSVETCLINVEEGNDEALNMFYSLNPSLERFHSVLQSVENDSNFASSALPHPSKGLHVSIAVDGKDGHADADSGVELMGSTGNMSDSQEEDLGSASDLLPKTSTMKRDPSLHRHLSNLQYASSFSKVKNNRVFLGDGPIYMGMSDTIAAAKAHSRASSFRNLLSLDRGNERQEEKMSQGQTTVGESRVESGNETGLNSRGGSVSAHRTAFWLYDQESEGVGSSSARSDASRNFARHKMITERKHAERLKRTSDRTIHARRSYLLSSAIAIGFHSVALGVSIIFGAEDSDRNDVIVHESYAGVHNVPVKIPRALEFSIAAAALSVILLVCFFLDFYFSSINQLRLHRFVIFVFLLTPIVTSGGSLDGVVAMTCTSWAFLGVVLGAMEATSDRLMYLVTILYILIVVVDHILRLFEGVWHTEFSWWTLAMYVVNEMVPSTLVLIPLRWMNHAIIDEENKNAEVLTMLHDQRERQDRMLDALLPRSMIEHLKKGEGVIFESPDDAAVLFCYIDDTELMFLTHETNVVIKWIDTVFCSFDRVFSCEFEDSIVKVETQHNHLLAVSGCPTPQDDSLEQLLRAAIRMAETSTRIVRPDGKRTTIRIGISLGPVSGGVVGVENPRFSIFGDTVVVAARMASTAEASKKNNFVIHMSEPAANSISQEMLVRIRARWRCELSARGTGMQIKGKGMMQTYLLKQTPTTIARNEHIDVPDHDVSTKTRPPPIVV